MRSGTLGPDVVEVGQLRRDTGCLTYDPDFTSTANCPSSITFIDGYKGELLYRGYPAEQLAERSNSLAICDLLLNGELPTNEKSYRTPHLRTKLRTVGTAPWAPASHS